MFTEDLRVRKATEEEIPIEARPVVAHYQAAIRQMQARRMAAMN